MLNRFIAVTAALLLVTAFAACGSEDEPEGEDFVAQANTICADATREIGDVNLTQGFEQDEADTIERIETIVPIREQALADLEALEPASEQADAYDEYLGHRADQLAANDVQLEALGDGDQKGFEKATADVSAAAEAGEAAATEAGLDDCGFQISEEDAAAAEDVLREFSTTADPATSCSADGLISEPYLEDGFGGVEACTKEQEALQKNPEEMPEDIEVSAAKGVDGVVALLEYEDVGGKFDGKPTQATLYTVDGEWKLYSIAPLQ